MPDVMSDLTKWIETKRADLKDRDERESRAFRESTHFGSHAQAFAAIHAQQDLLDELETALVPQDPEDGMPAAMPDGHFLYAFNEQWGDPYIWITTRAEFDANGCCPATSLYDDETGDLTPEGERLCCIMDKIEAREGMEYGFQATLSQAEMVGILSQYPDFARHDGFDEFIEGLSS